MSVCDRDCFNCTFDDCILEKLELIDYLFAEEIEREFLREKSSTYNPACYQKNKEKIAARQAAYRQKNKEKIAAQKAAYYQKNKEKIAAQRAARRRRGELV